MMMRSMMRRMFSTNLSRRATFGQNEELAFAWITPNALAKSLEGAILVRRSRSHSLRKRRHENVDTTILDLALQSLSYSTHKVRQWTYSRAALSLNLRTNRQDYSLYQGLNLWVRECCNPVMRLWMSTWIR